MGEISKICIFLYVGIGNNNFYDRNLYLDLIFILIEKFSYMFIGKLVLIIKVFFS